MIKYDTLAIDPDPDRPDIVVRLFLGSRPRTTISPIGTLYRELRRRHTYRGPMMATQVSPMVLDRLDDAARAEGAAVRDLAAGIDDPARETGRREHLLSSRDPWTRR